MPVLAQRSLAFSRTEPSVATLELQSPKASDKRHRVVVALCDKPLLFGGGEVVVAPQVLVRVKLLLTLLAVKH